MTIKPKPITETKIPGTDIPDVTKAYTEDPVQKRWMARVAVTTAILATLASLASMFATNHLNMAMISVIEASDQWAYYQAKGVKLAVLESKLELLPALGKTVSDEDKARATKYKAEQAEITTKAQAFDEAKKDHQRRQSALSRASTAFQVSIAMCAVALLVRKNAFWLLSLLGGAAGLVFFVMGMLPLSGL